MVDFPISINKITFMASEVTPYIRQCESDKAIEYVLNKTLCSKKEAEEVIDEIKNVFNYKYSKVQKRDLDFFTICPNCKIEYFYKIDHCTHCGYSTDKYREKMKCLQTEEKSIKDKHIPKCPTCGSTDISKISSLNRTASIVGFGILSKKIGKQWQCNNPGCKHLW